MGYYASTEIGTGAATGAAAFTVVYAVRLLVASALPSRPEA